MLHLTGRASKRFAFESRRTSAEASSLLILAALLISLTLGSGCNQVLGLQETIPIPRNAYVCSCSCTSSHSSPFSVSNGVCVPSYLDPSQPNGHTPTQQDLDDDCSIRVLPNVQGIVDQCVADVLACNCTASPLAAMFATPECLQSCPGEDLNSDCSNFNPFSNPPQKTATNFPGKDPICVVASSDPPSPVPNPLVTNMLGQSSSCNVSGNVTIARGSDNQTQGATGVVNITGKPCPGGSCQVGMSYRLDHINDFSFDSFGGFDSVDFQHLFAAGASLPAAATLDNFGNGNFPDNSTSSFGQGRRSNQIAGVETSSANSGYTGSNSQPVGIGVDWQNHQCEVSGTLLGQIESTDTSVSADLPGTIVNEPPTANAGAPQTVECTSSAGAAITLDGSASTDPENNIAMFIWRQGTRTGQQLGYNSKLQLNQAIGGSQNFVLKVVDAYGQSDESSTSVKVADTTPPVISSVGANPSVLWPPNGKLVPVVLSVSDSDTCDPHPTCKLTQITSNESITGADAQITGATTASLAAARLGTGAGRIYTLTMQCTDASGNSSTATTTVSVPHNQN